MSPPDSEAMAKLWLQYTHLEKLYGYLPGMAETQPAIFGLPLGPDQSVLAVGDSATDDLQSWAEILRHLLDLRRPGDRVRVVNGGLSAHTTAMVLRRWPAALAQRPDWVVCLLGGNDVTRVGPAPAKPQLGLAESIANLVELRRIATQLTSARWVWMTPTPVREDRVAEFPAFRHGQSTWRNADLLAWPRPWAGSASRSWTWWRRSGRLPIATCWDPMACTRPSPARRRSSRPWSST